MSHPFTFFFTSMWIHLPRTTYLLQVMGRLLGPGRGWHSICFLFENSIQHPSSQYATGSIGKTGGGGALNRQDPVTYIHSVT